MVFCLLLAAGLCCTVRPASAALTCTAALSDVNFGSVDVLPGAEIDTTATGSVTCSGGISNTAYRFCMNLGQGPNISGNQRNMAAGTPLLPYNLYSDAAHTHPFGNYIQPYLGGGYQLDVTTNTVGAIAFSGTLVYAAIPSSQQAVAPGSYTAAVTNTADQGAVYAVVPITSACEVGALRAGFSFNVNATIITNCNVGIGALAFPMSSVLSSAITATGSVSVQCTSTTPYAVGLDMGGHASGGQRRMYSAAAGAYISYGLYTDPGDSQPWGTTAAASNCTNGAGTCTLGTGSGAFLSVPIYGLIPPQTSPPAGNYADSVTVTVTY